MLAQNGTPQTDSTNHAPFDTLKAGVRKLIERIATKSTGEPSRLRSFAGKATDTIKAHPIAAATFALGLGYLVVRIARR